MTASFYLTRHQAAQRALAAVSADVGDAHHRTAFLQENLRSATCEVNTSQTRLTSTRAAVAAERDALQLVHASVANVQASCDSLRKQRDEADTKAKQLSTRLAAVNAQIAGCAAAADMRGAAATAWTQNAAAHEADLMALEAYTRRDERRVKEVQLALERTNAAVAETRHAAEIAAGDAAAAQAELDAARDELQGALASCATVEETVREAMRRRQRVEETSASVEQEMGVLRHEVLECAHCVDAMDAQAAESTATQRDAKRQLAAVQRACERARVTVSRDVAALDCAESELIALRRAVARATSDARAEHSACASTSARLEAARRQLEARRQALAEAQAAMGAKAFMVETMGHKAASLDKLLADETVTLERMRTELLASQAGAKAAADAAADAARAVADIDTQLAGCAASTRAALGRIAALDKEQARADEVLGEVNVKLEAAQRSLARAQGVRSEDETQELMSRISDLERVLAEREKERSTAQAAVVAARDAVATATRVASEMRAEVADLTSQVAGLRVEADGAARAAKDACKLRAETIVHAAVRRAELRRLRGACASALADHAQASARKTEAASMGAARRSACTQRLAKARADVREASDRVCNANAALREVKLRADTLRRRYESMQSKRIAAGSEPRTQEWYLAQAAQRKAEMEAQAQALSDEVEAVEKSVCTMEAALRELSLQNQGLKNSTPLGTGAADLPAEQQAALDAAASRLRALREEEVDAIAALAALRDALASCAAAQDEVEAAYE